MENEYEDAGYWENLSRSTKIDDDIWFEFKNYLHPDLVLENSWKNLGQYGKESIWKKYMGRCDREGFLERIDQGGSYEVLEFIVESITDPDIWRPLENYLEYSLNVDEESMWVWVVNEVLKKKGPNITSEIWEDLIGIYLGKTVDLMEIALDQPEIQRLIKEGGASENLGGRIIDILGYWNSRKKGDTELLGILKKLVAMVGQKDLDWTLTMAKWVSVELSYRMGSEDLFRYQLMLDLEEFCTKTLGEEPGAWAIVLNGPLVLKNDYVLGNLVKGGFDAWIKEFLNMGIYYCTQDWEDLRRPLAEAIKKELDEAKWNPSGSETSFIYCNTEWI